MPNARLSPHTAISTILPIPAARRLVIAAQTELSRRVGHSPERIRAVELAIAHIKVHYPRFFKEE